MTQQLRLVEPPEPRATAKRPTRAPRKPRSTPQRARRTGSTRTRARAASWGDWALDTSTRRAGLAGVAVARQALEAAAARAHTVEGERRAS